LTSSKLFFLLSLFRLLPFERNAFQSASISSKTVSHRLLGRECRGRYNTATFAAMPCALLTTNVMRSFYRLFQQRIHRRNASKPCVAHTPADISTSCPSDAFQYFCQTEIVCRCLWLDEHPWFYCIRIVSFGCLTPFRDGFHHGTAKKPVTSPEKSAYNREASKSVNKVDWGSRYLVITKGNFQH